MEKAIVLLTAILLTTACKTTQNQSDSKELKELVSIMQDQFFQDLTIVTGKQIGRAHV